MKCTVGWKVSALIRAFFYRLVQACVAPLRNIPSVIKVHYTLSWLQLLNRLICQKERKEIPNWAFTWLNIIKTTASTSSTRLYVFSANIKLRISKVWAFHNSRKLYKILFSKLILHEIRFSNVRVQRDNKKNRHLLSKDWGWCFFFNLMKNWLQLCFLNWSNSSGEVGVVWGFRPHPSL